MRYLYNCTCAKVNQLNPLYFFTNSPFKGTVSVVSSCPPFKDVNA